MENPDAVRSLSKFLAMAVARVMRWWKSLLSQRLKAHVPTIGTAILLKVVFPDLRKRPIGSWTCQLQWIDPLADWEAARPLCSANEETFHAFPGRRRPMDHDWMKEIGLQRGRPMYA